MATEPLVAAIDGSATVVADLSENLVVRNTQQIIEVAYNIDQTKHVRNTQQVIEVGYTKPTKYVAVTQYVVEVVYKLPLSLSAAIIGNGTLAADLKSNDLVVAITGSGSVTAALDVVSGQLSAAITGSATVGADLSELIEQLTVSLTGTANVQAIIQSINELSAGISGSGNLRGILVQNKEPLISVVSTTGLTQANLTLPGLEASILATGALQGNLTGTLAFSSSITGSGLLQGTFYNKQDLATAITGSGTVVADVRENTEYLVAAISGTGLLAAPINVPQKGGNTLYLTQTVALDTVISESLSDTLTLTDTLGLTFGQRSLSASNTLTLTDSAENKHPLPTQSADNTLSLNHTVVPFRSVESILTLTQSAQGTIYFISGPAFNILNLTHTVAPTLVSNLTASNILTLVGQIEPDQVTDKSASNTLTLTQLAVGNILGSKTYVLLQAPFDFIQTSIVIPNPLLDDTENLLSNLTLRRSMNGETYTYIKSNGRRKLKYTFSLDRYKALEVEEFFRAYNAASIKMMNWKGEIWNVKLLTNPIEFVQTRYSEPGGDRTEVNLEFEGVKLSG